MASTPWTYRYSCNTLPNYSPWQRRQSLKPDTLRLAASLCGHRASAAAADDAADAEERKDVVSPVMQAVYTNTELQEDINS